MAEPEPEVEPESEPEVPEPEVPEPEVPEPESESAFTEPEPYWETAFEEYGPAWELHVYSCAGIFLFIALLTIGSMPFYLKSRHALKQGTLTFTLQCLLLYFTLVRSLSLFINPYITIKHLPSVAFRMLWSLALPGLTASFSVLLLVFLDTTKMTLGPPLFQKLPVLLAFTTCHFGIVMISDIVCVSSSVCRPMLLFCQLLFIVYGTLLSIGYLYTAIVLHRKCINGAIHASENRKIVRLIKISVVASIVAFSVAVTHVYTASSEFGIYSDVTYVDAWDWWIVQSVMRFEEILSCCIILLIAFRNPFGENNKILNRVSRFIHRKTSPVPDSGSNQLPIHTITTVHADSQDVTLTEKH